MSIGTKASRNVDRPAPRALLTTAIAAIIAGVVQMAASAQTIQTQDAGTGDFRPYSLQHVQAGDVEAALSSLLPPGTEVVADRRANRVLVRGSSQSHQIAQRAVRSLDQGDERPSEAAPAPATEPVLKVYACRPGTAAGIAGALSQEFGTTPGVRIVPDQRTAQILVLAPPGIQTKIAGRLGEAQPGTAVPRDVQPGEAAAPGGRQTPPAGIRPSDIQLHNTTAEQVEASLVTALGGRLVPVSSGHADVTAYRMTLNDRSVLDLSIDRRSQRVHVAGTGAAAESLFQLIRTLDGSKQTPDQSTRLVPLAMTRPADIQRTVAAIRTGNAAREPAAPRAVAMDEKEMPLAARLFQPGAKAADKGEKEAPAGTAVKPATQPAPGGAAPKGPPPAEKPPAGTEEGGGLVGPVQIELLEGLDVLIIRGHRRDVQQVTEIIQQIEKLSAETEPAIEVQFLQHVDCQAMSTLINQLYTQVYQARQGNVYMIPLMKPNALLLVGRKENVERVVQLVKRLDFPVAPESQFQVVRLKHAAATTAQTTIQGFFTDRGGLGPVVRVTADARSNALVVQASPRDMAEVLSMIARIDTADTDAVNEIRLFQLKHTLADTLSRTLDTAIRGQVAGLAGAAAGQAGAAFPGAPGAPGAPTAAGRAAADQRSAKLQFVAVDPQGQRRLSSGILSEVRITADARANTLLVSAPAESMPLIAALVQELDQPPATQAQIKVFTIINSDATALSTMLEDLFGQPTTGGAAGPQPALQTAAQPSESSLVQLRFAVDIRTNSILATGTGSDLTVVEAILLRLDAADVRNRKNTVVRLKNAYAPEVATALSNFLRTERGIPRTIAPGLLSPFEQIEQEVVVVAEEVSNALIISATPRFYDEIVKLVEDLDKRPAMVMIQVLIAEVDLSDSDEFGVELGLQDSILFNRSLLGDIVTTSQTSYNSLGNPTATNQIIQSASNTPGFNFNNTPFGNSGADKALAAASRVGSQGLSNFAVGRSNSQLGFGGLVLSASSESVSVLLRALKENKRLEVLSRPQIQTLDNQAAYIQVGQIVPQIRGVTFSQYGQTNNVEYANVGLILQVRPRITPDGMVVMEIDAQKSEVGPEAEGIPISITTNGQTIRSPRINQTYAQTTVSAMSGQTILLGGLLSKQRSDIERKVPLLADVPVLGTLFRYNFTSVRRVELVIIMTPHIIKSQEDADALKNAEVARMHWCLNDVLQMHGDGGLRGRRDDWTDGETNVIYPDLKPSADMLPTPAPPQPRPEQGSSRAGSPIRNEMPLHPDANGAPAGPGGRPSAKPKAAPQPSGQDPAAAQRRGLWPFKFPGQQARGPDRVEQAAYEPQTDPADYQAGPALGSPRSYGSFEPEMEPLPADRAQMGNPLREE